MTVVEDHQSVEEHPAGSEVSPKEKKSVLKKVKDKVKKFGSKLKPKGHHENEERQELVEHTDEEEEHTPTGASQEQSSTGAAAEETPTGVVQPKDLSVPLDEYALLKQKDAEKRDDEASVKEGSLRDNPTEGLPALSLAEQEPSTDAPDALSAVPTKYNYKEGGDESKLNKVDPAAESESKPAASETESNTRDTATSEQRGESVEKNWPEDDFSLKTHGGSGREEELPTPTLSPNEGGKEGGDGILGSESGGTFEADKDTPDPIAKTENAGTRELSDKDIQEPDVKTTEEEEKPLDKLDQGEPQISGTGRELSDKDIQEPDVKTTEEEEKPLDKPDAGEPQISGTGRELKHEGSEGAVVDTKPVAERQDVKEVDRSASSKLEDETSVNTDNVRDEAPEEKKRGVLEKPQTEEGFADAKPLMEPAPVEGDKGNISDVKTEETEVPQTKATTPDTEATGTETTERATEQIGNETGRDDQPAFKEAPEVPGDDQPAFKEASEVPGAAGDEQPAFKEASDDQSAFKEASARDEQPAFKEAAEIPEAAADYQHAIAPTGAEDAKDGVSEAPSGPEEPPKTSSGDHHGEEVQSQVSKEAGAKNEVSEAPSRPEEPPKTSSGDHLGEQATKPEKTEGEKQASPSSGGTLTQKLAGLFGYSSATSGSSGDKKAEQERIVDEKAKETL